jgi:hypothetical protein
MQNKSSTIPRERLPPEVEKLLSDYQSGYLRESELVGAIKNTAKHESSKVFNSLGEALLITLLLLGFLTYKVGLIPSAGISSSNSQQITTGEVVAIPSKLDPNKIVSAMQRKGYRLRTGLGELNIIYVFNPDFANTIDQWSDRRMIITFRNNQPIIVHDSPATIKGGKPSWNNPPNPKGYPVVNPGQYDSWSVGLHKGKPALAQTGIIPVMRTKDQGKSWQPDRGLFGMNQHRGAGASVRNWSEGCLVSQSGHDEFMQLIYTDPGYTTNKSFRFLTTIISIKDLGV